MKIQIKIKVIGLNMVQRILDGWDAFSLNGWVKIEKGSKETSKKVFVKKKVNLLHI